MVTIRNVLNSCVSKCFQPVVKFREFWNKQPDAAHCFDMVELIYVMGGIRCKSTNGLVRTFWKVTVILSGFQFIAAWVNLIEQFAKEDNLLMQCWFSLMVMAFVACLFNEFLINRFAELVNQLQNFICSRRMHSQDLRWDSEQRKQFYQFVIRLVKVVALFFVAEDLFILTPNVHRDKHFAIPVAWTRNGPLLTSILEFGFRFSFALIWLGKYFCPIGTASVLMIGLKTEMCILVHQFSEIYNHVDSMEKQENLNSRNRFERLQCHALFWKTLDTELSMALEQHLQLLENIHTISPFIGAAFMCQYYFSLFSIGTLLFLASHIGSTVWFVVIIADVLMCLAEVYCWCYLIDSFQNVHESVGEIAFDICIKLPYCPEHHLDFFRTRTALVIIGLNTYHGKPMNCAGIFDINLGVFVKLVNTIYTVVTFLRNFG